MKIKLPTKLWFWVSNNGDGSVTVHHCLTEAEAVQEEKKNIEEYDSGFAEPTVEYVELEETDQE